MRHSNGGCSDEDFELWVVKYSDSLYRYALSKTNDKALAEDLVQDVFLSAYQSLKSFRGESHVKTWLFSILKNKILDFYRKHFRQQTYNETKLNGYLDNNFFDKKGTWILQNNPRHWSDIDGHLLDDDDFREVLNACVHKLPEMWSIAIQFKYLKGKNANEICQELEISTSNYWQIIHRAKLHLRKCLELNWFKK
jgi:RNA polymerase sigma-70 factor (TIGR02943 family)